jgi:hypothetical protein
MIALLPHNERHASHIARPFVIFFAVPVSMRERALAVDNSPYHKFCRKDAAPGVQAD